MGILKASVNRFNEIMAKRKFRNKAQSVNAPSVRPGTYCNKPTDRSFGSHIENILTPYWPNSDLSQTSHCNIKDLSVSEVMRIENMITQVEFY